MKAIVTGSFDPFTLGHLEIVKYARDKYDTVYVVALNNEEKSYMFSLEERKELIACSVSDVVNVIADAYSGLTADYMNEKGITHIIRGIRGNEDKEYELRLAEKMKEFNSSFVTEIVLCSDKLKNVSSTEARKRIENNKSLSGILHEKAIEIINQIKGYKYE